MGRLLFCIVDKHAHVHALIILHSVWNITYSDVLSRQAKLTLRGMAT